MKSETNIVARYAETDQMGIVHHSVYPVWFECGRTEWIEKFTMSYDEIERQGLLLPLLSLRCDYKSPALYNNKLSVITALKKSSLTRLTFSYEVIRKEDGKVICIGETDHTWTNKDLKPVNMKKAFPDIYQKLQSIYE